MYKIGINFDEISDNLDEAIGHMQQQNVAYGELRTVNKKNFVFWTDDEVRDFKAKIDASGIELVAAATPLFKWYDNDDDPEVIHDSFGFNPRLSNEEKKLVIDRAIDIARRLAIPRLRIFSGLGNVADAGITFAKNGLLDYALNLAQTCGIDLYIENEPVCKVNKKSDLIDLLDNNQTPNLKLWLDVSNLLELGEEIDSDFIVRVATRLEYIHVKDYLNDNGNKNYVPAGQGVIDYRSIMSTVYKYKPENIVVTVETHAKSNKVESSIASIVGTREIFNLIGVDYE